MHGHMNVKKTISLITLWSASKYFTFARSEVFRAKQVTI